MVSWAGNIQDDPVRRTVLEGHAALERTADSLARSQAIAAETETLGGEVIAELGEQRESLLRSKRRLAETDEELARSRSLMHKIACHAIQNKAILIVLILLESAILSSIVYIKWFRK